MSWLAKPRITTLRDLLLCWILGGVLLLVVAFVAILDYFFWQGVSLRTKTVLEDYAITYSQQYSTQPDAALPTGKGIRSYRALEELPEGIRALLSDDINHHGQLHVLSLFELDRVDDNGLTRYELGCEDSPCDFVSVYSYHLGGEQWLYIVQNVLATASVRAERELMEDGMVVLSFVTLSFFAGLAFVLFKNIERPVRELAQWADSLSESSQAVAPPDFHYKELNLVAAQLHGAFEKVASGVAKEHRFLRHASHELRTPIAVASGNLEVLEKLRGDSDGQGRDALAMVRLKHAIRDMRQMTETLLWLNRDEESEPATATVELTALVRDIVEQNTYLLEYKPVAVRVEGEDHALLAPPVLCQILLSNLVRNAFQHTEEGEVVVKIAASQIEVINRNTTATMSPASGPSSDYGYGLGLDLVSQIAERLGWHYGFEKTEQGRTAYVRF